MDLLVAGYLKEGQFQNFMCFMRSDAGISEKKEDCRLEQNSRKGFPGPAESHIQDCSA
jgi:hypothetical protein